MFYYLRGETLKISFKQAHASNFKGGRTTSIQWIVLHFTANDGDTAKNNADYFARQAGLSTSAHYFVDENEVWQSVKDTDTAWHCGASRYYNGCRNANSIGVEMCSDVINGRFIINDATAERATELVKYLMGRYNVLLSRVCRHYDVTHKECPEPWVRNPQLWENFKKRLEEPDMTEAQTRAIAKEEANKMQPKRYRAVSDMPEYIRADMQALIDEKVLTGKGGSEADKGLDLTEDMARMLIMMRRMIN